MCSDTVAAPDPSPPSCMPMSLVQSRVSCRQKLLEHEPPSSHLPGYSWLASAARDTVARKVLVSTSAQSLRDDLAVDLRSYTLDDAVCAVVELQQARKVDTTASVMVEGSAGMQMWCGRPPPIGALEATFCETSGGLV